MPTITLEVSVEEADAYHNASTEEQTRLNTLVRHYLRELIQDRVSRIEEVSEESLPPSETDSLLPSMIADLISDV